jgi:L-asparagine transporter-like permease
VAAGEADHPEKAVPRAARLTLAGLALFYVGAMAILVGVMPWTQAALTESPFVRVFQSTGIPFAAAIMNFIVLTAALSSLNANLYVTARMLFSLARGGYAPKFLGRLNARGVPLQALFASTVGMFLALSLSVVYRNSAFIVMAGASFFGGIFAWIMIFITHLAFRLRYKRRGETVPMRFAPRFPWTSVAGLAALLGVFISTWWVPGMKITVLAGLPWLAFITLCYFLWARQNPARLAELQAARLRE